jgi:hypothetical protein
MKPWKRPDLNLATPRAASKWPRYCAVKIPSAAPPIASLSDWSELKWRESCDWSGPCSTAGGGLLAAAWFQCWLRMQNNFGYGSQLRAWGPRQRFLHWLHLHKVINFHTSPSAFHNRNIQWPQWKWKQKQKNLDISPSLYSYAVRMLHWFTLSTGLKYGFSSKQCFLVYKIRKIPRKNIFAEICHAMSREDLYTVPI